MPVDASIPLSGVTPDYSNFGDPRQMMQMSQQIQKMQAAKQQQEGQMALRQIFADPKSIDASGNISDEAIKRYGMIDPQGAMDLRKIGLQNKEIDARMQGQKADLTKKKIDLENDIMSSASVAYEDGLKRGMPDAQARESAQKLFTDGFDRASKSGLFSEQELQSAPKQFDPAMARAHAVNYEKWQTMQGQEATRDEHKRHDLVEEKGQAETRGETRRYHDVEAKDRTATRDETRRYHDVEAGNAGERLKIERANAARAADKANQEKWTDNKEVQVKDADGNVSTVLAQQNKKTHEWIDAAGKPVVGNVIGTAKEGRDEKKDEVDAETAESYGKSIANYQVPPPTGQALRSPFGQAALKAAMKENPNYQSAEYGAKSNAYKSFATGKDGQTVNSFNVATSHLGTLNDAVDALNNKDMKAFNKVANAISDQFGGVAPNNFDAVKEIVGDELTKAILGSSGGALGDREAMKATLDRAKTPDQLKGAIEQYQELMAGQIKGKKQQYERTTGRKDFDETMLSEETRGILSTVKARKPTGGVTAESLAKKSDADILRELGITQ